MAETQSTNMPTPDNHLDWYKPTDEETESLKEFDEAHPEFKDNLMGSKLRFLRANDLKIKATAKAYAQHVEWRAGINPESIQQSDISVPLSHGTMRFLGITSDKMPVLWVQAGLWKPNEYDKETYEKLVAYVNTTSEAQMGEGVTTHIIAIDMTGWAFWHARYISYLLSLVHIVQDQYPERLKKIIVIDSPIMFRATYAILQKMMNKKTAEKVQFVNGLEAISEEFKQCGVQPEMLPTDYGGTQHRINDYPTPNVVGQPNVELKLV